MGRVPVAVLVAYDLDTGQDLSGGVTVTTAGATCWATALAHVDHPHQVHP